MIVLIVQNVLRDNPPTRIWTECQGGKILTWTLGLASYVDPGPLRWATVWYLWSKETMTWVISVGSISAESL